MTSHSIERLLLTGFVALAALAGILSGSVVVAIMVGTALYGARQVQIVYRLASALRRKQRLEPPFPGGPWYQVFVAVRELQLRSRKRKRRLNRFVSRFQDAAAALPDAVLILGKENRVEWFNPSAQRLLGLHAASGLGAPVTSLIREPVFVEYLDAGDGRRAVEIPAPGDSAIMLAVSVTPFGPRRQQLLMARDITRAYHLDQARMDFVANVSHELRTPLTVLSGNLEIIGEQDPCATVSQSALESMRENVERMRLLVDDLLLLSRLDMERSEGSELPVDVPTMLDSIVRDAKVLASASEHVLSLEVQRELWLRGSAAELQSAFVNLVNNAIRHTPLRTAITVRWYADAAGAHLIVSDNGPGIARRHLPRLTERFYRVDASRSARTGGTGLGLAIVTRALERHDASLTVKSREGVGSTFECHFAAARIETKALAI